MMTSEERRALAHQLLEDGRKLLPLLKEEDEDELAQQEGKKSSRIKSRSTTS
jgi:hypothetical protein